MDVSIWRFGEIDGFDVERIVSVPASPIVHVEGCSDCLGLTSAFILCFCVGFC